MISILLIGRPFNVGWPIIGLLSVAVVYLWKIVGIWHESCGDQSMDEPNTFTQIYALIPLCAQAAQLEYLAPYFSLAYFSGSVRGNRINGVLNTAKPPEGTGLVAIRKTGNLTPLLHVVHLTTTARRAFTP